MGYPRKIHALIVEDEVNPRLSYQKWFAGQRQKDELGLAEPTIVASLDEGIRQLSSDSIFHIVIADLGLPESLDQLDVADDSVVGVRLVHEAAMRDAYPVPVFAVVSGRFGHVEAQSELYTKIRQEFYHGTVLAKGNSSLFESELPKLLEAAQRYCGVGVHIRDAEEHLCPTLSPREEDLLRRSVLRQEDIGVDVEWWTGTSRGVSWAGRDSDDRTKVLLGRLILADGRSYSRYRFFKYQSRTGAAWVHASAAVLNKKLRHIKVCSEVSAGGRGLLVTESIGDNKPMSLEAWLAHERSAAEIETLVANIVDQLSEVGEPKSFTKKSIESLLRAFYDDRLAEAWRAHGTGLEGKAVAATPPELFAALRARTDEMRVTWASACHGDLNATNVAVETAGSASKAFIFDPGWVGADVAVRDLAYLEVTSLLFFRSGSGDGIVGATEPLYSGSVAIEPPESWSALDPMTQNTLHLILALRRRALQIEHNPCVYALMVLDSALGQLFGLAVQPQGNKIVRPKDAARLAMLAADWCQRALNSAGT